MNKRFKQKFKFVILTFIFLLSCEFLLGQAPVTIYESHNDSVDISNNFYDYSDSLLHIFSDTLIFAGWDTLSVHAAGKYWDALGDSIILPLLVTPAQQYIHPFKGRVTSKFGPRKGRFHYGTDIDLVTGDTVLAAFDGFVRYAADCSGYGKVVVIRHFNGLETLYAHLSKIETQVGSLVFAGNVIGLGGNTGRSYGDHLHFEIRFKGVALNPADLVDFEKFCLKSDTLILYQKNFSSVSTTPASIGDNGTTTVQTGVPQYHTVRSGDTLSSLAVKYHTTVDALCRLNNMKRTDIIRIGQKLRVK
jgi:hypothetical protein